MLQSFHPEHNVWCDISNILTAYLFKETLLFTWNNVAVGLTSILNPK